MIQAEREKIERVMNEAPRKIWVTFQKGVNRRMAQ